MYDALFAEQLDRTNRRFSFFIVLLRGVNHLPVSSLFLTAG